MGCRSRSTARAAAHRPSRTWGGCGELPAAPLRWGAGWTRHGGRTEGIPISVYRSGLPAGTPRPEEGRLAVDVAIRFVEALDAVAGAAGADPDLLPERLAHAAGTGPCLLAAESGLPVFANEEILACRWPAFHNLLVTETRHCAACWRCPCTAVAGRRRDGPALRRPRRGDRRRRLRGPARHPARLRPPRRRRLVGVDGDRPAGLVGHPGCTAPRPAVDGRRHADARPRGAGSRRARGAARLRLRGRSDGRRRRH